MQTKVGKKHVVQLMTIEKKAFTPTWQMEINELAVPIRLLETAFNAFSCIKGRKNEPAILCNKIGINKRNLKLVAVLFQQKSRITPKNAHNWQKKIRL